MHGQAKQEQRHAACRHSINKNEMKRLPEKMIRKKEEINMGKTVGKFYFITG